MNNKEKIAEIEEQIAKLQADVDGLKGPNEFELRLTVGGDGLYISYNNIDGGVDIIGYIDDGGYCRILSRDEHVRNHAEWLKSGAKVADCDPVKWRGGEYVVNGRGVLIRTDVEYGQIFDFKGCHTFSDCQDENIQRFEHNRRPIIF